MIQKPYIFIRNHTMKFELQCFSGLGNAVTTLSVVAHNSNKLGLPVSPLFMGVNTWHYRVLGRLLTQVYHTYLYCWCLTSLSFLRVWPHQKLRSTFIAIISFLEECFHFCPSWYFQVIDSTCYLLNLPMTTWFMASQPSDRCTSIHQSLYICLGSSSLLPTSHYHTHIILWISPFKCLLAPLYLQDIF